MCITKERKGIVVTKIILLVVSGFGMKIGMQDGKANPEETQKCIKYTDALESEIEGYNKTGVYPADFVEKLRLFYHYGVGSKDIPSDPVGGKKYCRKWVISFLEDVLSNQEKIIGPPAPDTLNPPSVDSRRLLLNLLREILESAPLLLDPPNRLSLYEVVGIASKATDLEMLETLKMIANTQRELELESAVITQIIQRIESKKEQN